MDDMEVMVNEEIERLKEDAALNFEAFRIEAEERHIELIRREQATTAQLARALDEVQSLKNELEQAKHRPSSPDHIASTRHEFETAVRRDFEVHVRASRRATRVSSLFVCRQSSRQSG